MLERARREAGKGGRELQGRPGDLMGCGGPVASVTWVGVGSEL